LCWNDYQAARDKEAIIARRQLKEIEALLQEAKNQTAEV
jgi:hypothetical protein